MATSSVFRPPFDGQHAHQRQLCYQRRSTPICLPNFFLFVSLSPATKEQQRPKLNRRRLTLTVDAFFHPWHGKSTSRCTGAGPSRQGGPAAGRRAVAGTSTQRRRRCSAGFSPFTAHRAGGGAEPPARAASSESNGEKIVWWKEWIQNREKDGLGFGFGPGKVLRSIAGATSSPIFQFIPSPATFLHSVDPRIKLVWLVVLVFLPARSHIYMRFGIVFFLALLSTRVLPEFVWKDQLFRVTLLSVILFIMLGLSADGALPSLSSRTPPPSWIGLPNISSSLRGYNYLIFKFGPLQMTRKGLAVASTSACLTFTVLQSASLCLSTTPPEQLASALRWFLLPLVHLDVPVAEIVLTLMLSLRFMSLIFDEVRNVALGILSRRVDWKHLTLLEKVDVFVMYIRRVFQNIFSHAEQISQAMIVRGFRGDSRTHRIHFPRWSFATPDFISILVLFSLIGASILSAYVLV